MTNNGFFFPLPGLLSIPDNVHLFGTFSFSVNILICRYLNVQQTVRA